MTVPLRYRGASDLGRFADALREVLGLEPIHHDLENPKVKNQEHTERFHIQSMQWYVPSHDRKLRKHV